MKKLFLFFYVCVSVLLNLQVKAGAPTSDENNLIKNGHFNNLTLGFPDSWGFWSLNGGVAPIIEDGVAVCSPVASANVWEYLLYQTGMEALPNIPYIFSFRAWSDADRSIGVTFQDSPENKYNRYGSSNDPEANYGGSDWTLNISSTPTTYTFHVIFDKMVPTTVQYLQFMLNASSDVVYIDDVSLVSVEDLSGIKVSLNSAVLSASEGSVTKLLLTTTSNWTANSDQSWLTVSPNSGTGDKTLVLTAKANNFDKMRTAKIIISADGFSEPHIITITQNGLSGPIEVSAGNLINLFTDEELATLTKLTLSGTIDARDFKTMRDNMPLLAEVDLSGVSVVAYTGTEGTSMWGNKNYAADAIPEFAFSIDDWTGQTRITSILIPGSITSIGALAFADCKGLKAMIIPPLVTEIGYDAFRNGWSFSSIDIPPSVTNINHAFRYFTGLINVDANNPNYSSIDGVLFNKTKTSLILYPTSKSGSYSMPSSVVSIETIAFAGCSQLTSIQIPSSVQSIYWYAFSGCSSLTSLNIPSSVTTILDNTFEWCGALTTITVGWPTPLDLNSSPLVFRGVNISSCVLNVPYGTTAAYRAANQWQDFTNIVEMPGFQLSATTINIGATQGSPVTVDLTSNTDWTATSDQSWLTVAPTAGTGNQTLNFTANANPQSTSRTATVTISATGVEPQSIIVKQASLPILTVSAESVVIGASANSTNTFKITSSIDWTATSNQSWLTLQPSSFVNSSPYSGTYYASGVRVHPTAGNIFFNNKEEILTMVNDVTIQKDFAGDYPYKTQIQITNNTIIVDGKTMIKVNVTISDPNNSTGSGMLDTDQNGNATNYFDPSTRTYNLSYYYNTIVNRKIYEVLVGTITTTTSKITLTAAENPTSSIRDAAITITANGIPDNIVNVTQDASPVLTVSTNSLVMAAEANSVFTFNVQSTTDWTISGNQDWLSISKTSGTNSGTIILTASANETNAARNATITVTATGGVTQTINVMQFGIVPVSGKWNQFFHGESYTDLSIVDENVIWLARPSGTTISYTMDGGKTWTTKNLPTELSGKTGGFSAVSATTAYIICSSGAAPGLYKTTDGANTWTLQTTGFSDNNPTNFYGRSFPDFVYFWNPDNGLAYGDDNEIYTTSNGGVQWVRVSNTELRCGTGEWSYNSQSVYKVVGNTIYILVGAQANSHSRILKSTDKGLTWSSITPPTNTMSASFDFKDDNNGLYVDYSFNPSKLYSTNDGGKNWASINSSEDLRYLKYIPNQNIYISNNLANGLMYSENNGQTWTNHPSFGKIRTFNDVFSVQGITYMSGSGYFYSSQNIAGINTSFDQVKITSSTSIDLKFSNDLELTSSNDAANYEITYTTGNTVESINIVSALRDDTNQALVHLITQSALPLGTITISVSNVYDLNGYPLINGSTSSTQTFVINLLLSATSVNIGYADGSTASVSVTSNISWTASSDQLWLTVDPETGSNNQTITFTAEGNPARSTRSAVVTFSGTDVESQTVTITQAGNPDAPLAVTAGGLKTSLTADELASLTKLTLTGTIDARDFKTMRDDIPLLADIDLSDVDIVEYTGTEGTAGTDNIMYPANAVPEYAFSNGSFQGKPSLTTIIFPAKINQINQFAFVGCHGLTTIAIPPSVITLGNAAFYYCKNLTTVTIPSSVTIIESQAFLSCGSLNSVYIPSSVLNIGYRAFAYCKSLITVDETNPNYSDVNGVLFNKNKTELLQCPISKTGTFTIPSSVTAIGLNAFEGCAKLTIIEIPSSVQLIDDSAFKECFGLSSITIPSSVKTIKSYAFAFCNGLTSINAGISVPIDLAAFGNVFYNVSKTACILIVPYGSKTAYQAADQWKDFINIVEMPGLNLSATNANVAAAAGSTASVEISSNVTWTASSDQSWLTVDPTTGTGNLLTVTFTAIEANTSATSRIATVTVSADGVESQTIKITQQTLIYEVLEAFYYSTGGDNWTDHTNWLTSAPISTWNGISVDDAGLYTLSLNNNNLDGQLPANLGDLVGFKTIQIRQNPKLIGTIPESIGDLSHLSAILLSYTGLSGEIPETIGNLKNLGFVEIYGTKLGGSIPSTITSCTKLKSLYLTSNLFETLPDLTSLNLWNLYIENNKFQFDDIAPAFKNEPWFFEYSPQAKFGEPMTYTMYGGQALILNAIVGGTGNVYQWYKDGNLLDGETANTLKFEALVKDNQGVYTCHATNPDVPNLTLESEVMAITVIPNEIPLANAGTDQSVNERTLVTLNGSASADPDNDDLTYKWVAPVGIILSSETEANPTFTAPAVMTDTDLIFTLTVNDGQVDSPSEQVVITVIQIDEAPIADAGPDQTVYEGDLVTLEGAIASNQPILKQASVVQNTSNSSVADNCPIDYNLSIPVDATFAKTTVTRLTFTGPEIVTITDHLITLEISDESNPDNQENALKFQWPIPAGVKLSSTIISRITIVNPKDAEDKECTFSLMVYDGSTSTEPNATTVVYVNIPPTGIPLISTTNVKLSVTSPEVTLPVDYTYSMLVYDGSGSADPNNGATIYLSIPPTPIKLGSPTVGKLIIKAPTDQTDPNYDFLLAVCTDSESPDPDDEELTYHWFAPEGIELLSETENKATFIAPEVDVDTDYTFRLMVNNGKADSQSDEVVVTVRNRNSAPLANAGNDLTVNEGSPVTLDGKYSSDPDNDVLNYIWIAPDGIEISSDSESNLIFVAPEVNEDTEFIFSLIVSDGMLNSEIDEIIVTVKQVHKAPTAKAGFDQTANEGTLVTLDGSASFVVDGAELKYKWTAPEGIMLISETDKISTFIAPEVSTDTQYTFSLIVNDGKAESTIDEVVITVLQLNKVPFADAGLTQSVEEGTTVLLDGTASSDSDGDALTYKWTSPVGIVLNSDSDPNPSFTAPEVSADTQYTFYLEVNDGKTTSPTVEVVIEVLDINVKGAAEISGYVYEDTNNGTKSMSIIKSIIDHGKPFEGAFIQLFKSGETTPIATTQTDLNGFYRFDHLEIAEYGIVVEIPGFIQSEKFRVVVSEQEPLISVKFLVNTNTGSITDVNPILLSSVKIYPNPTKGRVQLKFNQIPVTGTWISVYDASGSLILKSPALDLEESINLEGNPAGLYFIKLGEKSYKTYKLVLE